MGFTARDKAIWCAVFALVMGGPYLAGADLVVGDLASSPTYAFCALGALVGLWLTSYQGIAALFRQPRVWKGCLAAAAALVLFPLFVGLIALYLPQRDSQDILAFSAVVGSWEPFLIFLASLLCMLTSAIWQGLSGRICVRPGLNCLVFVSSFAVGLLRLPAWNVLFTAPLGVFLIYGGLFEWVRCVARGSSIRLSMSLFCMGELFGRLISRCGIVLFTEQGPQDLWLALWVVLLVVGVVASILGVAETSEKHSTPIPQRSSAVDSILEPRAVAVLEGVGLTAREIDVLEASLSGCTSHEIANSLGIGASTVRTYRGRVCKKLGYASFDQVLGAWSTKTGLFVDVAEDDLPGTDQPGMLGVSDARDKRHRPVLRLSGCLILLTLILMPYDMVPRIWDCTWFMAYAVALGMTVACIPGLLSHAGFHFETHRAYALGSRIAFLISGACCVVHQLDGFWNACLPPLFWEAGYFVSLATTVCLGIAEIDSCITSQRLDACKYWQPVALAAVAAAAVSLSPVLWTVGLCVALLLYLVGTVGSWGENVDCRPISPQPSVLMSWFVIAFIWEECWRGWGWDSLQDIGVPFLLILIVVDIRYVFRLKCLSWQAIALLAVLTSVLCVSENPVFGLLILTALVELLVGAARVARYKPSSASSQEGYEVPLMLACAAGCCAAVYVANVWNGGPSGKADFDWTAIACFTASIATILFRIQSTSINDRLGSLSVDDGRLGGYLVGKGLSSDEVTVCEAIARGESVAQIAESMSYSVSAVNMMKRSAFSRLRVGNKFEFASLLYSEFSASPH